MEPMQDLPSAPYASITLARRPLHAGVRVTNGSVARGLPGAAVTRLQVPLARRLTSPAPQAAAAESSNPQLQQQREASTAACRRLPGAIAVPFGVGLALLRLAHSAAVRLLPSSGGGGGRVLAPAGFSDVRVFPSMLPRHMGNEPGGGPSAPGAKGPALVWFRSDLRVTDHEALCAANQGATSLVPVYCFDPREYGQSPSGFDKTGAYRAAFIITALRDLRQALRDRGSDLIVRIGRPEEVLAELAAAVGATRVYCYGEVTAEERGVEQAVARALDAQGAALKVLWGGTLFHPDDLPFQLSAMPVSYGEFRDRVAGIVKGPKGQAKRAGSGTAVRKPLAAPDTLKGMPAGSSIVPGDIPSLHQLGFSHAALQRAKSDAAAMGAGLCGGERNALHQMHAFLSTLQSSSTPKRASPTFAAKVSPWLAIGCISPRTLYHSLRGGVAGTRGAPATAPKGQNDQGGMSWLLFELMWRDFFRFINLKLAATTGQQAQQQHDTASAYAMAAR